MDFVCFSEVEWLSWWADEASAADLATFFLNFSAASHQTLDGPFSAVWKLIFAIK
jgi:hypothetical protein